MADVLLPYKSKTFRNVLQEPQRSLATLKWPVVWCRFLQFHLPASFAIAEHDSARARTGDLARVRRTWWPLHYGIGRCTLATLFDASDYHRNWAMANILMPLTVLAPKQLTKTCFGFSLFDCWGFQKYVYAAQMLIYSCFKHKGFNKKLL